MSTNSSKWKKALLPTLGNRRRGRDPTSRLPASRTAAILQHAEETAPGSVDDEVDERVVSVLLETTNEADNESQSAIIGKNRGIAHSQTVGVMPCTENSSVAGSPARVHSKVTKLATPPRRSSKRNLQAVTHDFARSSPKRSADGLVRPLPKLRSSNLLSRETRRIAQSPSVSPGKLPAHCGGKGTIRKSGSYVDKTNDPLVSVFAGTDDLNGSAVDSTGFGSLPKMSRLRKNKVFAKFATALSEHFSRQETRKEQKSGDGATESLPVSNNEASKPILHGLPLGRLTLAQLPLPDVEASSASTDHLPNENGSLEDRKGSRAVATARTAPSMPQKRLSMVEGSPPLEDPFSEESPGRQSTEFEARLKNVQASGAVGGPNPVTSLTDPFLTEAIMDTSDNSILKTPPIGSSTPRARVQALVPIKISSEGTQLVPDARTEVTIVSPDGPTTSPSKRRKFAIVCDNPTKLDTSLRPGHQDIGSGSPSKARGSSDSTRLSSFPPGSTIRHVPRSMGRLTGLPDLAASAAARRRSPKVGRKKHPSPSKRDLDLYGKFMEESVGLGVFKDTDELALSFTSFAATNSPALAPRDKNNLLRGSTDSHCDSGKGFSPKGPVAGLSAKSRSRIPQPVSQRARSRSETAFARDFAPANHGDSTTEDELQWNSSTYVVGRGRDHRCQRCGSMTETL
ncbi:hypothetical protein INS49_013054 [Diaporthe citri]|uniref:uncharacterized protein n=1 Tax=Diaporthe citri TaxID=83186 RepID=UPI001C7E3826|nr:uncharacterized protein INS49_013054 [Diaporthe citri]KAG6359533.1 hypothetical protein INS49_013054 [Diaporthe citri]